MTIITTRRLRLRPVERQDAAALEPLFNSWEVIRWLSSPPWPYTSVDMTGYIDHLQRGTAPDREILHVVEADGKPAGAIGHRLREASHLQPGAGPNIGYWLGQPYWGRGYMSEAAAGLTAHLFGDPSVDAVYSGAFAGNMASLRVQEKLGFTVAGYTMLLSRPHGLMLPHVNTVLRRSARP